MLDGGIVRSIVTGSSGELFLMLLGLLEVLRSRDPVSTRQRTGPVGPDRRTRMPLMPERYNVLGPEVYHRLDSGIFCDGVSVFCCCII